MSEQAHGISTFRSHVNYTTKYLVVQSDVSQLFGFLQLKVNSLVILFLMNFSDIVTAIKHTDESATSSVLFLLARICKLCPMGPLCLFGLTCEVEMAFTFLIVEIKFKIRIVFCDKWKLYKNQMSVHISKVLWEFSHTYLFTYCPWLPSCRGRI